MTDSDEVKLLPWSFEARLSSDGLAWEVVDVTDAADPILVAVFDSKGAADDFHEENAKIAAAALNARQFGLTRPPVVTDEVVERVAREMCFADYDIAPLSQDEFWTNPQSNHWLMQEADEWDNGILTRLGREGYRRHARASMPAVVSGGQGGERFWLILQEPGRIPEKKGSWLRTGMAAIIREFIAARPTAYIAVLTVSDTGEPHIEHGPELLQMLDGRSMNTGRKHNERTRIAHAPFHAQPEIGE